MSFLRNIFNGNVGVGTTTPTEKLVVTGNTVVPKTSGYGIMVDTAIPSFGWRDIIGQIVPRTGGAPAPAFTAYHTGAILDYAFQASDKIDLITYHMPHDYLPNTPIYLHTHWGHNGTAVAGTFTVEYFIAYCKGHNQITQTFGVPITVSQTTTGIALSSHPQWGHFINETLISNASGDSTHIPTSALEVDGLVKVAINVPTIPTITGSATSNLPYIFTVDIHYQSTNVATKQKDVATTGSFYT